MIDDTDEFAQLPVTDFVQYQTVVEPGDVPDVLPETSTVAWRIALDYDSDAEDFAKVWDHFLDTVAPEQVRALIIGNWWGDDHYQPIRPVLDVIAGSAHRLPGLRALFLGDVDSEECELSWLQMCDVTPVLEAFPRLEEFVVRGCCPNSADEEEGLAWRPVRHEHLRALRCESGGLSSSMVRAIGASELPRLERLELWMGVVHYGGDATVADLAPFLAGTRFPALRHLGLENSEVQDEIAAAVASAPVVAQLDSLSLALGTLTDAGAEALLTGQPLNHLSRLDLHHHYVSDAMAQRIRAALEPSGVRVDLSEQEEADFGDEDDEVIRYVAASE
ncbi:STM4015 family protein [Streptomyces zagrosensis]|uniref:Cytoplasmic protein n=1 Tax=Streptomyces zagrosensis TaxID=1042984 RepID=A0A7W9QAK3_9ACTN|nr:STM4015 family protein [Streptomyces zagrosensis]MBB5936635.1 hypothetical protein [Streptomyces zagrosensis]